jgi:hypothetical protein
MGAINVVPNVCEAIAIASIQFMVFLEHDFYRVDRSRCYSSKRTLDFLESIRE